MKNLVLYAPPAAGKGTLCEVLTEKYGYNVISIGQVLRNNRSMDTEIGRIIIETQDKGILTPDDIVAKALDIELKKYVGTPLIIEGYPRNIAQAKLLDTIFENYIVINLDIPREVAMQRALGRVNCSNCNKIYNLYDEKLKPKKEGICDECGAKLDIRSDDNKDSFIKRFSVYEQNAPEILEFYRIKDILYRLDSSKGIDYVSKETFDILDGSKND